MLERIFDFKYFMDRMERRGYDRGVLRVLINNGVTEVDVLRSQEAFNPVREALANKGYWLEDRGLDQEHSTLRLRAAKYIEGRAFSCTIAYELLDSPDYRRLYQINEDSAGCASRPSW